MISEVICVVGGKPLAISEVIGVVEVSPWQLGR